MFHYGEIYTDLDHEGLRSFDHLLMNYSLVFGAMKGQSYGTSLKEGYVQNSLMYSKPRHEFCLEVIFGVVKLVGKKKRQEKQTGPIFLSNKIEEIFERNSEYKDIKIYASIYINPFSWIGCHSVDKNFKALIQMTFEE